MSYQVCLFLLIPLSSVQVVQGAAEPGGHQAAGGDGRLCPGIPGAFSQPAGEHADQDQSRWWVNMASQAMLL